MRQHTGLNEIVLRQFKSLKISYTVQDNAPSTLRDIVQAYQASKRLVVWSGASDNTIYGDASVNWVFRAWHDYTHIMLNAEFTDLGERLVAMEQARQANNGVSGIVIAEVVGQLEYKEKHGNFPVSQIEFIESYLKLGKVA